ncbi:MAG: aromatic amino acid ammonia-lyase [Pseudomonadota bacterium]
MFHPRSLAATVSIDDRIGLTDARAIICGHVRAELEPAALARVAAAHARLRTVLVEGRHVYGLTTGFGPLANRIVSPRDAETLQQNLVHHLASGVGPELGWAEGRAVAFARLMSIVQGVSGASTVALQALMTLLASDLAPVLPARGTVGASGDLTPLAHLVLCLQGRSEFMRRDGQRIGGPEALDALGLSPLSLAGRDALALVNGTSAMTGIATLNAGAADRAAAWALRLTAALCDVLGGHPEAWHPAVAEVRPHPGQVRAAAALRAALAGGDLATRLPLAMRRLADADHGQREAEAGQDAYTLRCAPQVIGAVLDTFAWHDTVVERELNAATDNPIFPADGAPPALHGGNFMGQHVALVSDALAGATTVLAGLAERQISRVTDERLNRGLPAFLHRGQEGVNSGMMGAQVTATALLCEMRALSGGASVQSLSTNGANQDVVSLGTIAARLAADRLADLGRIQAILAICVAQAVDLREASGWTGLAPATRAARDFVRQASPALLEDRPLGAEIEAVADAMALESPLPG